MKYHLNYDHINKNGIVVNELYADGVPYIGERLKPTMSFSFDSFIYSEQAERFEITYLNKKSIMTDEQKEECKQRCKNWVQELGQAGNPNEAQKKEMMDIQNTRYLESTDWYVIRNIETGKPIPEDVIEAREIARASIG